MRIPRIYQDKKVAVNETLLLDEPVSHYLISVLRMNMPDKVILFNNDGYEYTAMITAVKRNFVEIKIESALLKSLESPLHIHLAQVISKGERMDLTLQKATELGVAEITPLFSRRSEVRLKGDREQKKMLHWQKVIIAACCQCGRTQLPRLYEPMPIEEWLQKNQSLLPTTQLMLDPFESTSVKALEITSQVVLLVGPEGGLTVQEKSMAKDHGFQGIHLGPRVLRTETAGMTAITALQVLWGDLG